MNFVDDNDGIIKDGFACCDLVACIGFEFIFTDTVVIYEGYTIIYGLIDLGADFISVLRSYLGFIIEIGRLCEVGEPE